MRQATEFGEIPINWAVKKIIDIKSDDKRAVAMGPFGSNIKAENFVNDGVPVIRGTNMNYSRFVDGNFVFLTEKKADELISSNCEPDDIVFTHRGTIGQVALIPHNKYKRYIVSQSGMKLTVNKNVVEPMFILYFFKSEYGQYQILKYEAQVGVPSLSNPLTSLKEMEIPVPSLPEQKAIASVLSSLDDKIDLLHPQKMLENLQVKRISGNKELAISIKNNQPYFVTVAALQPGGSSQIQHPKNDMISPFASETFHFPRAADAQRVRITLINDQGARISADYPL